jgi:predicted negative regulator of RcsB-dependent stress response
MTTEVKNPREKATVEGTSQRESSFQRFWVRNNKYILYAVGLIVLLGVGYIVYENYFKAPKEQQASDAMWKAEQYFRTDSARLALNGDGQNPGFLRIMSRYGGTKAANLAKFYAAASYMKLGDFNNAIRYLKDFSTDDELIQLRATGLLGDAYSETGKRSEAAESYRKAGTMFEADKANSSEYLFRAGLLYQDLGKNKEAIEVFRTIKEKYAATQRGIEIDKYLARLGEIN